MIYVVIALCISLIFNLISLYKISNPDGEFIVDDSDPDDISIKLFMKKDIDTNRICFIKVRKADEKDS